MGAKMALTRTGITRRLDDLGRVVMPKEFRDLAGINTGDILFVSLVSDDNGNMKGFLLEPADWVLNGSPPELLERIKAGV